MDESNEITIPVNALRPGDEFWQDDLFLYRVTGNPKPWSGAVRVEVQYVDGGRAEREWVGSPEITVRRPS